MSISLTQARKSERHVAHQSHIPEIRNIYSYSVLEIPRRSDPHSSDVIVLSADPRVSVF